MTIADDLRQRLSTEMSRSNKLEAKVEKLQKTIKKLRRENVVKPQPEKAPVSTEPVDPKGKAQFLKVDGKFFHCEECGSNLFTRLTSGRYGCNGCNAFYLGTGGAGSET